MRGVDSEVEGGTLRYRSERYFVYVFHPSCLLSRVLYVGINIRSHKMKVDEQIATLRDSRNA